MDKEIKIWLFDIKKAISEIDSYFELGQKLLSIIYQKKKKLRNY